MLVRFCNTVLQSLLAEKHCLNSFCAITSLFNRALTNMPSYSEKKKNKTRKVQKDKAGMSWTYILIFLKNCHKITVSSFALCVLSPLQSFSHAVFVELLSLLNPKSPLLCRLGTKVCMEISAGHGSSG